MLRGFARRATDRPVAAVFVVTAFALLLRLVGLGARSMHWDEARVAYWTLRYAETGLFAYRPIVHGPLVPIVTAPLFEWLGPTDAVGRLPVAILGGLAPLAALPFRCPAGSDSASAAVARRRFGLDDAEMVTLAVLVAVLPAFVYYSRFIRSDVPLAVFALFALGFAVRALATGRRRHVVAAGLALGFALATKENVLVYLACALGAAGVAFAWPALAQVVADRFGVTGDDACGPVDDDEAGGLTGDAFAAADGDGVTVATEYDGGPGAAEDRRPARADLRASAGHLREVLVRHAPAVPVALLAALLPVVFFYAPRGAAGDPSLGAFLAGDASVVAFVARATLGTWQTFTSSVWAGSHDHSYAYYLGALGAYLLVGSLPLVVGAGYAAARELRSVWRGGRGGHVLVVPLVAWGVAALVGYPVGTDIPAPWIALHIAFPLLIPAAIGWVALARRDWWRPPWDGPPSETRLAALGPPPSARLGWAVAVLVVLSAVHVPIVLAVSSVTPPLYVNVLAQADQPATDLDPMVANVTAAADDGGVLYYGETYYLPNETLADRPPREGEVWPGWWTNRLPMAWYVERVDAPTVYARSPWEMQSRSSLPPVVFVASHEADEVDAVLRDRGYATTRYDLELYADAAVVVYVDTARLDGDGRTRAAGPSTRAEM